MKRCPDDIDGLPWMSHPVRVRGLKQYCDSDVLFAVASHPVRVRGLKHEWLRRYSFENRSHPVRVRGLKR